MPKVFKAKKMVKESEIPAIDDLYISNYLTNEAIRAYVEEFKTRVVPFSFIEMYFDSMSQSAELAKNAHMANFFNNIEKDKSLYCFIYCITYNSIIKATFEDNRYGYALMLKRKESPAPLSLFLRDKQMLLQALDMLKDECTTFNSQAPHFVKNAYSLYLKDVDNYIEMAQDTSISSQAQSIDAATGSKMQELVGAQAKIPEFEQKKVYKLIIPQLPLPSDYPKAKSRIHSSYHVRKLLSPSKTIDFVLGHRLVQVTYAKDFLDIRNESSSTPKVETKRNWSDFF